MARGYSSTTSTRSSTSSASSTGSDSASASARQVEAPSPGVPAGPLPRNAGRAGRLRGGPSEMSMSAPRLTGLGLLSGPGRPRSGSVASIRSGSSSSYVSTAEALSQHRSGRSRSSSSEIRGDGFEDYDQGAASDSTTSTDTEIPRHAPRLSALGSASGPGRPRSDSISSYVSTLDALREHQSGGASSANLRREGVNNNDAEPGVSESSSDGVGEDAGAHHGFEDYNPRGVPDSTASTDTSDVATSTDASEISEEAPTDHLANYYKRCGIVIAVMTATLLCTGSIILTVLGVELVGFIILAASLLSVLALTAFCAYCIMPRYIASCC